jgi:hypothetical protein
MRDLARELFEWHDSESARNLCDAFLMFARAAKGGPTEGGTVGVFLKFLNEDPATARAARMILQATSWGGVTFL